jgi:CheY-like chemotaxis protein
MRKAKIFMVVDDDSDDRELFTEAVNEIQPDAKCISCANGEQALQLLRNAMPVYPDYIFLDLNMPIMDGNECLVELKKDASLRHIPVVIFSTSSTQKDKDETTILGAIYFLTKPTSYKKLCEEIQYVLETFPAPGE